MITSGAAQDRPAMAANISGFRRHVAQGEGL
jgi:hypothetical protein